MLQTQTNSCFINVKVMPVLQLKQTECFQFLAAVV